MNDLFDFVPAPPRPAAPVLAPAPAPVPVPPPPPVPAPFLEEGVVPVDGAALVGAFNAAAEAVGSSKRASLAASPAAAGGCVVAVIWPGRDAPIYWPVEVVESMTARMAAGEIA